jgi:hypothetical protein
MSTDIDTGDPERNDLAARVTASSNPLELSIVQPALMPRATAGAQQKMCSKRR